MSFRKEISSLFLSNLYNAYQKTKYLNNFVIPKLLDLKKSVLKLLTISRYFWMLLK